MPKCLECGFEAPRLQWTHFKYKCSGRFNNGTEYKKVYPDAKLVDDDLAKKTALTLENFILKYGKEEGERRWNEYRSKQSLSNSYTYKKEKHGWSKDQYDEFNRSRATTLNSMIIKHGEEEGIEKWNEYCDRQRYTKTKEYFVEQYGKKEGIKKYIDICKQKAHTVESIQDRLGITKEEAIDVIQSHIKLGFVSELEKKLIDDIEIALGKSLDYSYKTKQYAVWSNDKINFYDIVHNKKCIEFNGDYWHCNPSKYNSRYYHPHTQMLAEEMWDRDNKKINAILLERNIETMIVWESDYRNNPEKVVKKCLKWIATENT